MSASGLKRGTREVPVPQHQGNVLTDPVGGSADKEEWKQEWRRSRCLPSESRVRQTVTHAVPEPSVSLQEFHTHTHTQSQYGGSV